MSALFKLSLNDPAGGRNESSKIAGMGSNPARGFEKVFVKKKSTELSKRSFASILTLFVLDEHL